MSIGGRFEDQAYAEIAIGNRYIFQNSIDVITGQVSNNVLARELTRLAKFTPSWFSEASDQLSVEVYVLCGGADGFLLNTLDSFAVLKTQQKFKITLIPYYTQFSDMEMLSAIPWVRMAAWQGSGGSTLRGVGTSSNADLFVIVSQFERIVAESMDELLKTFECNHHIASVGAKVIGSNYELFECGGGCFADTGRVSFGSQDDPNRSDYCYSRTVDFVSGCFAIRKNILLNYWAEADYELPAGSGEFTDLFHFVQSEGLAIQIQPLAKTILYGRGFPHHSSDVTIAEKHARTTAYIRTKWPQFYLNSFESGKFVADTTKGHILFIDYFIPDPTADAGSVTSVNLFRTFLDLGYRVSLLPTIVNSFNERLVRPLARIGVEVLSVDQVNSIEDVWHRYSNSITFIFGVRVVVIAPLLEPLKKLFPNAPMAFFDCDLHYVRMLREAKLHGNWRLHADALRTKKEELRCISQADCAVVHTDIELAAVNEEVELKNIKVLPYVTAIRRTERSFDERFDVMFVGGYEHIPNEDAVVYFVNEIWPLIQNKLPSNTRLLLVGSKPSTIVKSLADDNVIVTGQVPQLGPYFDSARVFIAPLRYGAGIKGKVLTAMANGVPSVITSIAAEGMNIRHDDHVLCADTAESFGAEILRLYNDERLWLKMQEAGYNYVEDTASIKSYGCIVEDIIETAKARWSEKIGLEINKMLEDDC